ncbi:hypothetical protein [Chamaesiphon sp. VAR_48_metabat_135_sub]|uniref:hypothetical protein n=1 Tax=Chamaesiphon sp. VAR_48_metabat_135_sub TaxID=2964699 RepID=UPI00286A099C|nr:hypothetical protein [Chamaesiphon sp. VAR_48_metabat_135_sub]
MKGQIWYIALPIGLMCAIRFSLSAFGYASPHWLMEEVGLSLSSNPQIPYTIRVWAIRDIVLSILIVFADKSMVKMLLFACVAIDSTDIISAYLSGLSGVFDATDGWLLKLTSTAIAALILDLVALTLLFIYKTPKNLDLETSSIDK